MSTIIYIYISTLICFKLQSLVKESNFRNPKHLVRFDHTHQYLTYDNGGWLVGWLAGTEGRVVGGVGEEVRMMMSLCRCIVALHILKEQHRLQNCCNVGTTTSH